MVTSDQGKVDPERRDGSNAFDTNSGYSGQEYHVEREDALGDAMPSGTVVKQADVAPAEEERAIPPENGRRARFDPATGEVKGSGSGAGGGNPGEDYDSDAAAGDGYPLTGGERAG